MKKLFLTLKEALTHLATAPKTKYLWGGIKEKTSGLVFGVSKSGKTIFCENLGIALAIGRKEFIGQKLDGRPRKVLFVGLEEYWAERVNRNKSQLQTLSEGERKLCENNFMIQPLDFTKYLINKKHWRELENIIVHSKAEVVFIDSITRMNHGILEESKTAEEIMQKLRDLCHKLSITLISIHHTRKFADQPITMDKIKGSGVFAQESDFALGINVTSDKSRYQKDVFFRYAADDSDKVREFRIDDNTRIDFLGNINEFEILHRTDRRREDGVRDKMLEYFRKNECNEHEINDLVKVFEELLSLKERRIKGLLSELVKKNKLDNPKRGIYKSVDCINPVMKKGNEEE